MSRMGGLLPCRWERESRSSVDSLVTHSTLVVLREDFVERVATRRQIRVALLLARRVLPPVRRRHNVAVALRLPLSVPRSLVLLPALLREEVVARHSRRNQQRRRRRDDGDDRTRAEPAAAASAAALDGRRSAGACDARPPNSAPHALRRRTRALEHVRRAVHPACTRRRRRRRGARRRVRQVTAQVQLLSHGRLLRVVHEVHERVGAVQRHVAEQRQTHVRPRRRVLHGRYLQLTAPLVEPRCQPRQPRLLVAVGAQPRRGHGEAHLHRRVGVHHHGVVARTHAPVVDGDHEHAQQQRGLRPSARRVDGLRDEQTLAAREPPRRHAKRAEGAPHLHRRQHAAAEHRQHVRLRRRARRR
eukprot:Rhum_TRINITY_DN15289_c22_g1::Rhum_TRINITY_DN15289_c22_g1_i1::g.144538::m.144538